MMAYLRIIDQPERGLCTPLHLALLILFIYALCAGSVFYQYTGQKFLKFFNRIV